MKRAVDGLIIEIQSKSLSYSMGWRTIIVRAFTWPVEWNLLFSVHKLAVFYQRDNDFPQISITQRSSHPQKLVLHGVLFNLTTSLLINRPQALKEQRIVASTLLLSFVLQGSSMVAMPTGYKIVISRTLGMYGLY